VLESVIKRIVPTPHFYPALNVRRVRILIWGCVEMQDLFASHSQRAQANKNIFPVGKILLLLSIADNFK
jgi:hypothetical protein